MTATPTIQAIDWDAPAIARLIRGALDEDLGGADLTAMALVQTGTRATARIIAKQELVLAGLPLAERVFRSVDAETQIEPAAKDGSRVAAGACVARISGRARAILLPERTALNFLAHLSGIATLTRRFVDAIAGTRARIRDTRKTTPLLRALEKYAVRAGGGTNHRFGLFDAILIKENHIAVAGGAAEAMRRAQDFAVSYAPVAPEMTAYESFEPRPVQNKVPIQIEARNEAELRAALAAGADAVLLDNVSPEQAARLVELARRERPACVLEISGGVSLENVRAYAETGVDFISVGALTHSAPAADLTLLVEASRGE